MNQNSSTAPLLRPRKLRELNLLAPAGTGRASHLSAASGLVRLGERLYVVADDEHHLAVFPAIGDSPGQLVGLLPGELPQEKRARKKVKPDFEVLLRLPPFAHHAQGALLALGSGSRPQRQRGVLLAIGAAGGLLPNPQIVDLAPLFGGLREQVVDINIEGAVISGERLILLQRGNKAGRNACVEFSLAEFLRALESPALMAAIQPRAMRDCDLGEIAGVPLCFSDGTALPNGDWLFTAIAEDTDNSYADGRCMGAAVGLMRADGELAWVRRLAEPHKIEGIEATVSGADIQLLLVTDADDPEVPASLLTLTL